MHHLHLKFQNVHVGNPLRGRGTPPSILSPHSATPCMYALCSTLGIADFALGHSHPCQRWELTKGGVWGSSPMNILKLEGANGAFSCILTLLFSLFCILLYEVTSNLLLPFFGEVPLHPVNKATCV